MPIQVNELSIHVRLFNLEEGSSRVIWLFFNCQYGIYHLLNNLSLNIDKGEIIRILTNNDLGKTTSITLPVGLLHPLFGYVNINGFAS